MSNFFRIPVIKSYYNRFIFHWVHGKVVLEHDVAYAPVHGHTFTETNYCIVGTVVLQLRWLHSDRCEMLLFVNMYKPCRQLSTQLIVCVVFACMCQCCLVVSQMSRLYCCQIIKLYSSNADDYLLVTIVVSLESLVIASSAVFHHVSVEQLSYS